MTPDQRRKLTELFVTMFRSSRPPEPKTPYIYADFYEWPVEEVGACLDAAARQEGRPLVPWRG